MAKEQSFEKKLQRLQETVDKLSEQDMSLDESVALYREAQGLLKQCADQLGKAKNEVRLLSESGETLTFIEQPDEGR